MKQSDFPEWAQRVKEQYKGTQLRKSAAISTSMRSPPAVFPEKAIRC